MSLIWRLVELPKTSAELNAWTLGSVSCIWTELRRPAFRPFHRLQQVGLRTKGQEGSGRAASYAEF